MSEQTKPEAISEELTKEQLDGVAGGFLPVTVTVVKPITPPAAPSEEISLG